MIAKNRDAVRATWSPETKALYQARSRAVDAEFSAEVALRDAKAALRAARKNEKAAASAFMLAPGGREFWAAVRADLDEEDLAAKSAAIAGA